MSNLLKVSLSSPPTGSWKWLALVFVGVVGGLARTAYIRPPLRTVARLD